MQKKIMLVALASSLLVATCFATATATTTVFPASLPSATVGVAYCQTITATDGNSSVSVWPSVAVPLGMRYVVSGGSVTLEGTPTTAGIYQISLLVFDNGWISSIEYSLIVNTASWSSGNSSGTNGNLILNSGVEASTINPGLPDYWNESSNAAATFFYPVPGQTGYGIGVQLSQSNGSTAYWYPNSVPVVPNETCTFSDAYLTSIPSIVTAQFTDGSGNLLTIDLANLSPTNGSWAALSPITFSVPGNMVRQMVFHRIQSSGFLLTDNYVLACSVSAPPNTAAGGCGNLGSGGTGTGTGGSSSSGQVIFPSAENPLTAANTTTSRTSVSWSNIYPVRTNPQSFTFTDIYTDSGTSNLIIEFTAASGSPSSIPLSPFPAGTNAQASITFSLPALAPGTPIKINHNADYGTIIASNPMLTELMN